MGSYCASRNSAGFYCVLAAGHNKGEAATPHLSIDNTQLWEGTPGLPIQWTSNEPTMSLDPTLTQGEAGMVAQPRPAQKAPLRFIPGTYAASKPTLLDPTLTQGEAGLGRKPAPGYTGIPCGTCGSPNTVRVGSCLQCHSCHSSGECG